MKRKKEAFGRLLTIMDELREKCPWDKKQTMLSLRNLTIEETYELADAIIEGNDLEVKEELGDLALHIVFYAKIAEEEKLFDIADALNGICDKLIKRHPHIYGNLQIDDAADVKKNWERIKISEGKTSVLSGVPKSLPAMVKAYRIQEKTAQVGFEWENKDQVWDKLLEEIDELKLALLEPGNQEHIEEELGDVIFSLINYARFLKIDPENALEKVNRKFINRFKYIEKHASKDLEDMSLSEMDELWNEAKLKKNTV